MESSSDQPAAYAFRVTRTMKNAVPRDGVMPCLRVSRSLLRVTQFAPQDLADVGLRQVGAELDVFGFLIAGQLLLAELHHIALGERRILLDDEELHCLSRVLVGHADRSALEHAREA